MSTVLPFHEEDSGISLPLNYIEILHHAGNPKEVQA